MRLKHLLLMAVSVAFAGCSPSKPDVPDTAIFPAGSGEIEIRYTVGKLTGEVFHSSYPVDTHLIYVKKDGSDLSLELRGPSFHKFRPKTSVVLRAESTEAYSGPDSSLSSHDTAYGTEKDVYIDLNAVSSAEFDGIAKCFKDNLKEIEEAYNWTAKGKHATPPYTFMNAYYYDVSMFGKKYYWSENPNVYIWLNNHDQGVVEIRVPLSKSTGKGRVGPSYIDVGQILMDGRRLLLCDLATLDQHRNYSLSFEEVFKDVDRGAILQNFADENGKRLSDHFETVIVPVEGSKERFQAERRKFVK